MALYLSRDDVDTRAAAVLRDYGQRVGRAVEPPIDIDGVGELLYDLRWEYAFIEGQPRDTLAALHPSTRIVRLSETYAERFTKCPGLERFTKSHEIGHWLLHVNRPDLNAPLLTPDASGEHVYCRNSKSEADWTERQADWFAASLLMPGEWVINVARQYAQMNAATIGLMADDFGASREAMSYRLERLGLIHVGEHGRIYRSKAERSGQRSLF